MRGACLTAAACLLFARASFADPDTIAAEPAVNVAVLIMDPDQLWDSERKALLVARLNDALLLRGSLVAHPLRDLGLEETTFVECRGAHLLGCWARAAEPLLSAPPAWSARYLMAIALRPGASGAPTLTALLLDLRESSRELASVSRRSADWRDGLEDRLFALTARAPPFVYSGSEQGALEAALESLSAVFEHGGHWRSYGSIELSGGEPGLDVELDGVRIGRTSAARVRVVRVRTGKHRLVLRQPDQNLRMDRSVEISRGAALSVPVPPPVTTLSLTTVGAMAAGGVAFVTGAAVLTVALVRASDGLTSTCLQRGDATTGCQGIGAIRFGYDPEQAPIFDRRAVNPSGVLMGPLGASLMLAGAVWGTSAWLADEQRWIWWAVAGAAAGVAVYGGAALLEPR